MLLNEDLGNEIKSRLKKDGYNLSALGRMMDMKRQKVDRMFHGKLVFGKWIDFLDMAGYDVEVVIKKKEYK